MKTNNYSNGITSEGQYEVGNKNVENLDDVKMIELFNSSFYPIFYKAVIAGSDWFYCAFTNPKTYEVFFEINVDGAKWEALKDPNRHFENVQLLTFKFVQAFKDYLKNYYKED